MTPEANREDEKPEWLRELELAVNELDCDVVIYRGPVQPPFDRRLMLEVRKRKSRDRVLLCMATNGGSADSAFRIARCLSQEYRSFTVFVDAVCKSAGTLIALAANELVMSDAAELGPLDVQLSKPDELDEWTSGLTPIQSLSTLRQQSFESFEDYFLKMRYRSGLQITTKTALEIAAKLVIGLYGPIFEQMDPMRLGEIQRAMMIAFHYGERLGKVNLRPGALERLIAEYPSHGFIIDRTEAGQLFHNVRKPMRPELKLANSLPDIGEGGLPRDTALVAFFPPRQDNAAADRESGEQTNAQTRHGDDYQAEGGERGESGSSARAGGEESV